MYFWWGTNINNFLFYGFNILTIAALVATCLGLLGLALVMEWLGLVQAQIRHKELIARQQQLRRICPADPDSYINSQEPTTSQQALPVVVNTRKRRFLPIIIF